MISYITKTLRFRHTTMVSENDAMTSIIMGRGGLTNVQVFRQRGIPGCFLIYVRSYQGEKVLNGSQMNVPADCESLLQRARTVELCEYVASSNSRRCVCQLNGVSPTTGLHRRLSGLQRPTALAFTATDNLPATAHPREPVAVSSTATVNLTPMAQPRPPAFGISTASIVGVIVGLVALTIIIILLIVRYKIKIQKAAFVFAHYTTLGIAHLLLR